MRPLAIVFLGCVPLAVLTVSAFVELGPIEDRPAADGAIEDVESYRKLAEDVRAAARADKPIADELVDVVFLGQDGEDEEAGRLISGLDSAPAESLFGGSSLAEACSAWATARALVADFLKTDRLTATAELGQLKKTGAELEALKAKCEASSVRGRLELVLLVDRRIAALSREISDRERMSEAEALLARASAAFVPQQYAECMRLCDQLLTRYSEVMEPGVVEKVRLLRQRAQFRDETERLFAELRQEEVDVDSRAAKLELFLGKYSDRASRTSAELQVLDQCRRRWQELKAQQAARQRDLAAAKLIQDLSDNLPAGFGGRLQAAARIVDQYPTEKARTVLRASVVRWIGEFCPEKPWDEEPMLQEAETTDGQIVRGFFGEVRQPGGRVIGYKRYPSYQRLLSPIAEVGTYRIEDLRRNPGPSVPRSCAARYNQARARLLEHPDGREVWAQLADLCDALEKELEEYRKKPGSESHGQLSFDAEGRLARQMLDGPGLELIGKVTGG